jgi:hypothetical protein
MRDTGRPVYPARTGPPATYSSEYGAGGHGRASQLSRVALSRVPNPSEMRRIGGLVRSTIEALELDGQVDEEPKWLAWGRKYSPTEFRRAALADLRHPLREARQVQEALAALQREPDPLSTPLRGQLVARAMRFPDGRA